MKGLREGTEYLRTGSVKDSAVEILSFSTSVLSVFTHLFQFFGSGFGLVPLNRFRRFRSPSRQNKLNYTALAAKYS